MGLSFMPSDDAGYDRYATQPLVANVVEADHPDDVRAEKRLRELGDLAGRRLHLYTHAVGANWWRACEVEGTVLGFTYTVSGTRVICLQTEEHPCVAVPVRAVDMVDIRGR